MRSSPSVLVIGVDPLSLDPAEWGVTPEQNAEVMTAIARGQAELEGAGYEVGMCLVPLDESLEEIAGQHLEARGWDCVVIGGGLRKPPELLATFERVVNLVHRRAPQAVIAFNERPSDLLDAVQRAVSPARKDVG